MDCSNLIQSSTSDISTFNKQFTDQRSNENPEEDVPVVDLINDDPVNWVLLYNGHIIL